MESYKFLNEASTVNVPKIQLKSVFTVEEEVMPEFYADILAGQYKLPNGVLIVMKSGEDTQIAIGDGENTWGDSVKFTDGLGSGGVTPEQLNARVPAGGANGQVLKKDAQGNNTWQTDANTTYTAATQAEIINTASTTGRLTTGQRNKQAFDSYIKGGVANFVGDDSTESFQIPHGLGQIPVAHACNRNADSGDTPTLFSTTVDATSIWVMFSMPPGPGVEISVNWIAFK